MSFKVTEELFDMIENYARMRGIPKSEVIRRAIMCYITSVDDKPFITKRIKIYS